MMKKTAIMLALVLVATTADKTLAARDDREEKTIRKYENIIDNAAPDDWYTLARSADQCLQKNINRKEVAAWIERSLEIKETAYNLEVKGDYFMINHLPEKAAESYLKAIRLGSDEDPDFDASGLQEKIARIIQLDISS